MYIYIGTYVCTTVRRQSLMITNVVSHTLPAWIFWNRIYHHFCITMTYFADIIGQLHARESALCSCLVWNIKRDSVFMVDNER